jgi:hypothetical protein
MSFDQAAQNFMYGIAYATGLLSSISPVTALTVTGIKTGARIGRSYCSFLKGGWYNPCFYGNCLSATSSAASLSLQCMAYGTSATCPPLALPLFAGSQAFRAAADVIDSSLSVATFF